MAIHFDDLDFRPSIRGPRADVHIGGVSILVEQHTGRGGGYVLRAFGVTEPDITSIFTALSISMTRRGVMLPIGDS